MKSLSNLQSRKIAEGIPTILENHFSPTNNKKPYFLESFFLRKKFHSAENGALSSQNAFFKPKTFMNVKGVGKYTYIFAKKIITPEVRI